MLKDRWNREVEEWVRNASQVDWTRVRDGVEGRVRRGFEKLREGLRGDENKRSE